MRKTAVEWLIDMLVTENEITLKGETMCFLHHSPAIQSY
jgi:hypothetical protein